MGYVLKNHHWLMYFSISWIVVLSVLPSWLLKSALQSTLHLPVMYCTISVGMTWNIHYAILGLFISFILFIYDYIFIYIFISIFHQKHMHGHMHLVVLRGQHVVKALSTDCICVCIMISTSKSWWRKCNQCYDKDCLLTESQDFMEPLKGLV